MSTCIVVDGGADLIGKYPNVFVVPLRFIIGVYVDDGGEEVLDKSSAVNVEKKSYIQDDLMREKFYQNIDKYRDFMDNLGIEIEYSFSGQVKIYKKQWFAGKFNEGWLPTSEKNIIASWSEPKIIKKVENKYIYSEIHIKEWSIFDKKRK